MQGAKIKKYGITTGETIGEIVLVSTNVIVDNINIFDVVSYTNTRAGGDSGGPFGFPRPRSGGLELKGIHFAGSTNTNIGYGIKIGYILDTYDLQVVTSGGLDD